MTKLASVSHIRWAFYEAQESQDMELMSSWFETLYEHYKIRGIKIKQYAKMETTK